MNYLVGLVSVVALLLSSFDASAQQPLRTERHGTWTMNCSRDRMTDEIICSVFARARGSADDSSPLIMIVGRRNGSPELFLAANRAVLASGGLRVGSALAENFRNCSNTQCYLHPGRSSAVISMMESQPEVTIYVRAQNRIGPVMEGEASLEGFAAAMESLRRALRELR